MSARSSSQANNSQADSALPLQIAARLREERIRVAPHQGQFAKRIGLTQQKQSFLENGSREIRAPYLATIAAAGLDVLYILTGQRMASPLLSRKATELLNAFELLIPEIQDAAVTVVTAMGEGAGARRATAVMKDEQIECQVETG